MKQRPILFSAPMVRALLDGSKTQTRRVCKNPIYSNGFGFDNGNGDLLCHNDYLPPSAMLMDVKRCGISYTTSDLEGWTAECPYGQVGDQLWVRENFQPFLNADCDGDMRLANWKTGENYHCSYPATDGIHEFLDWDDNLRSSVKPSIHMPRWASRIQLEITGVRIERLNDISDMDCEAEGVRCETAEPWFYHVPENGNVYAHSDDAPKGSYRKLWESINGAGSWEANPWVWVLEFKRVEQ